MLEKGKTFSQKIRHSNYIVRDHRIHGVRTLPGVTLLDMIYRLSAGYIGTQAIELKQVLFKQPVVTSENFDRDVLVTFIPRNSHWEIKVVSQKIKNDVILDSAYDENMECLLFQRENTELDKNFDVKSFISNAKTQWDMDSIYRFGRQVNIQHFEFMKTLGTVYLNDDAEIMHLHLSELAEKYRESFYAHPAFLDGSTLAGLPFQLTGSDQEIFRGIPYIPFLIQRFCIYRPLPKSIYTYTKKPEFIIKNKENPPDIFTFDITIFNELGEILVKFEKMMVKRIREPHLIKKLIEADNNRLSQEKTEFVGESSLKKETTQAWIETQREQPTDTDAKHVIQSYLQKEIGQVLKKNPGDVDINSGFYELGLDSTNLLGLVKVLEEKLGEQLYPTLLFEYSTIQRLSDYLSEDYANAFSCLETSRNKAERKTRDQANSDSRQIIVSYLQQEIGRVLKKNSNEIDVNSGFYELGLDSTNLLSLVKQLEEKLGEPLYPTLLFEYSTIERLAEYLLSNYDKLFLDFHNKENNDKDNRSLQNSNNANMVFLEPGWYKQNIMNQQAVTQKHQHIVILFSDEENVKSAIQQSMCTADVIILTSREENIVCRFEDKFIQLLQLIQERLGQKTPVELLLQIVADSDSEGKYVYALAGMLKTAYLENPKIHSQIIAIDKLQSQSISAIVQILQKESLAFEQDVLEICYRGEGLHRYIRQLNEKEPSANTLISYKENGVYVITGGLGGLGILIADHIANQVKSKLVLIGRSQLDSTKEEKIRQLRQKGAEVLYLQADISKKTEIVNVFNVIKNKFGFITGIFHNAGVLKDQVIIKKNLLEIQDVFRPKVHGLWYLDEATQDEEMDFFIVFSSLSAITGNLGQADYATANAFMDVFATFRQDRVKEGKRFGKTISINWPLWSDGGMQVDDRFEEMMAGSFGMKPLPAQLGLKALDTLLSQNRTRNIVFYGDKSKMRSYLGSYIHATQEDAQISMKRSTYVDAVKKTDDQIFQSEYRSNDIAIIGLSGRYPMADSIREFYQNLREGRDCISNFPKNRWKNYQFGFDVEQFYKYGGFLDHIDEFDPLFFNIAPRQAEMMDPQARLFLETVWEACEDAGFYQDRTQNCYPSSSDKSVGVFAGVFWNHYELFGAEMTQRGIPTSLGISPASIPNMVSYCLNFHGPSMAVDTMCSSALTAIHLACESIRHHQCHYAIAGGVNLVTHPHKFIFLKQAHFLSSDGRCRSFGQGGDGYVPGEGVGAVLLTTLERAQQEGYPIYGIIKGSALNHVGKTSGVTVPDPIAQSEVIADALKIADVDPRSISYIEAHGTGTALGDPIEIQGLKRAFNQWTQDRQYCAIGSSKSNIGHLEAAAGIGGLTKLLLQLKHQEIFPSLHSEQLNPYISFDNTPFYIEHNLKKWNRPEVELDGVKLRYPRRAGLSSFGANGSNAHIIVEEYISQKTKKNSITINEINLALVPLSAKNRDCLKVYAQKLLDFLKDVPEIRGSSNEQLARIVEGEIIQILAKILSVKENDIDPVQDLSEFNADYIQMASFHQNLQERYGLDIDKNIIFQVQSIRSLTSQFIQQYQPELEQHFFRSKDTSDGTKIRHHIDIVDLAYTLQVGREAMDCRVVFNVKTINELIEKLELFIEGKVNIDNCFQGLEKRDRDLITTITYDEDMKEVLDKWIDKGKKNKLAELWVKGLKIDWDKLYGDIRPHRINLPTYPFAREHYWISAVEDKVKLSGNITTCETALIHPLLQQNTSDFSEQRFSSTFTGQEFFLMDHVVQGKRVLPGVAFLEMARAAVDQAVGSLSARPIGIHLKNVVWAQPVIVKEQAVQVNIGLYPEDTGEVAYEIYSESECGEDRVIYSQGRAMLSSVLKMPVLDLKSLQAKCSQHVFNSNQCYEGFRTMGVQYDPAYQGIEKVYVGQEQVLAKISLSVGDNNMKNRFVLHPILLDAAIQASLYLTVPIPFSSSTSLKQFLPVTLEELETISECPADMWALIRYSYGSIAGGKVQKIDIDLCDEQGNVCVRMKKCLLRVTEIDMISVGSMATHGTLLLYPCWQEQTVTEKFLATDYIQHLVMLLELGEVSQESMENHMSGVSCLALQSKQENIGERFQNYAVQVFEEIQRIIKEQPKGKVLIQIVIPAQAEQQLFSGIAGMLRTARFENPKLIGQLIEVEQGEDIEEIVEKLKESSRCLFDDHIRYEKDKRYVIDWREFENFQKAMPIPWKNQGVYLITGGAGGLGYIVAKEIANKVKDVTMIFTGRSLLNKDKQVRIKELEALGARIEYKKVDVTHKQAVVDLIQNIQENFGGLNGIIHSAGIIHDNFILKKTKEELQAVMAAKVTGLVNLDQASKDISLDFLVLFSSTSGVFGNPGQVDYSTANAFMDAYAKYRNSLVSSQKRYGKTLSISWPLWKEGGMRIDAEVEKMIRQSMGIVAMETVTGIQALYRGLASGRDHMMVLEGDIPKIREQLLKPKVYSYQVEPSVTQVDIGLLREKTLDQLKILLGEITKLSVSKIDIDEPLENYGIDSVMITQLNHKFAGVFGELSKTLLYEYQTLGSLAEYFIEEKSHECMLWTGLAKQVRLKTEASKKPEMSSVKSRIDSAFSVVLDSLKPQQKKARSCSYISLDNNPREPIAIIGMSGRYPQARNLKEYWDNLQLGKDCITEIPRERWTLEGFYHPDPKEAVAHNKSYSKWGGFVEKFSDFDPLFFNISPREAINIDPQERLFIESCWEVLEDGAYTKEQLRAKFNSQVGVFAGITKTGFDLYGPDLWRQGEKILPHTSFSSVANRVSYLLNLQGPSMTIDTMCSASLTAIHEACEHLYQRECEMAIAGGVNLYLHPANYSALCAQRMLSVDGKCKSFGYGANGFVPGEGVGCVLLKRLSQAVKDQDHIYAVIRGSSINHGGKTNGYTVPNPAAQRDLIRSTLNKAGVNARTISYVEAHGTGTELGDPIEITGLTQAFGTDTKDTQFCAIGSVKSNIGHLEAAAGVAGLTKIVLQMKHQKIVPSLHAKELNHNINFVKTPFVVQQELAEWKRPVVEIEGESKEYPRIASISAFGAGGSNAHAVIEEYIANNQASSQIAITIQNPAIIILSAKEEERLCEQVLQLLAIIEEQQFTDESLADMAYTLQVGREAMEERLGLIVGSIKELKEKLNNFVENQDGIRNLYRGQVKRNKETLSVFGADEDMAKMIDSWIAKRKYAKLLDLWVKGLNFDWDKLYSDVKPRRISLPTYPFAREKYWLPKINSQSADRVSASAAVFYIHPLVHQNTSDFSVQRFSSIFTGQEFFLADHIVKGQRVLPGVAYLEIARAAVEQASGAMNKGQAGVCLKNVVWARPIVVEQQPVQVNIRLFQKENGNIVYEIYSDCEMADAETETVIYSQGNAMLSTTSKVPTCDLQALQAECSQLSLSRDQCYEAFRAIGIEYGQGHQGISKLYVGSGQVLAKLSLPSSVFDTLGQFVLHPSLMDSALQASIGLNLNMDESMLVSNNSPKLFLPFALEQLEIFNKCTSDMWALIRYSNDSVAENKVKKLDIDLIDNTGIECVRMKGVSLRVLEGEVKSVESPANFDTLIFQPCWHEQDVDGKYKTYRFRQHLVILCELPETSRKRIECEIGGGIQCLILQSGKKNIAERFQDYAVEVLGQIQNIIKEKPEGKVLIQIGVPSQGEQQLLTGLSGLLKTAQLENPKLMGQMIEIEDIERIVENLKENSNTPLDKRIRYQDGKRLVGGWSELEAINAPMLIPWKDRGIYLITGGLGGLGYIFSKEIAGTVKESILILTGRSPLNEAKQVQLKELQTMGVRILYKQVDITQKNAVIDLIQGILNEFGSLNGIIHSAGVIHDNFILKKTKDELQMVLAPKVTGLVNLDQASKDISLDFFILFSSIAGALGNSGQADYSAANAFMDAYAGYRNCLVATNERYGHTLAIDWPLWKNGGMHVNEQTKKMMQNMGIFAIPTSVGIRTLYQCLAVNTDNVMMIGGNINLLEKKIYQIINPVMQKFAKTSTQSVFTKQSELPKEENLKEKMIFYLKQVISNTLKMDPERMDINVSLSKYGLDSIVVLEINNRLEKYFDELSKTLFFEYSTINELANYFIKSHKEALVKLFEPKEIDQTENTLQQKNQHLSNMPDQSYEKNSRTKYFAIQQDNKDTESMPVNQRIQAQSADNIQESLVNIMEKNDFSLDNIVNFLYDKNIISINNDTRGIIAPVLSEPLLIHEDELKNKPEVATIIKGIDDVNSPVGYERLLYPYFFITSDKNKYLRLIMDQSNKLIFPYTVSDEGIYQELLRYSQKIGYQLLIVDLYSDWIDLKQTRLIPLGVWQNIVINQFTLAGNKMRKVRYLVEKFRKSGEVRIEEYHTELNLPLDEMKDLMIKWSEDKKNVIHHSFVCMEELLRKMLPSGHRAFLTYHNNKLCSLIVMEKMQDGIFLMDQEFYDAKTAPLGHMEYAIVKIIEQLKTEDAQIFSLGLTWFPFAFEDYPHKDNEGWAWLKEQNDKKTLLAQIFHQGETNYQFKKKFGVVGEPVFAYLPKNLPFSSLLSYWTVFYQNSLTSSQLIKKINLINLLDLHENKENENRQKYHQNKEERRESLAKTEKLEQLDYNDSPLDLQTDSWYLLQTDAVKRHVAYLKTQPHSINAEVLHTIFPFKHIILTAQGRSAELLFYQAYSKKKKKIVTTIPWTTTLMHQLQNGFDVVELPHSSVKQAQSAHLFKGEMDLEALTEQLQLDSNNIAFAGLEVLSNASGGNPVRLSHIQLLKTILQQYQVPLVLDASRIVRNAFLIKEYEEGFKQNTIWDIVKLTFEQADHVVTSLTKDFAVSVGGLIATNDDQLATDIRNIQSSQEQAITVDMKNMIIQALAEKETIIDLITRQMAFTKHLQDMLVKIRVPILQPAYGHAIVIDVSQLANGETNAQKKEQFLRNLFIETGIRGGIHQVGKQKNTILDQCIRLAIPLGLTEEDEHIIYDRLNSFFKQNMEVLIN